MKTTELPRSSCPHGYTADDLKAILGDRLDSFHRFMTGQTVMICEGRRYVHTRAHSDDCGHDINDPYTWECDYPGGGHWENDACAGNPHGIITYRCDLETFLAGKPPLD